MDGMESHANEAQKLTKVSRENGTNLENCEPMKYKTSFERIYFCRIYEEVRTSGKAYNFSENLRGKQIALGSVQLFQN